MKNTLEIAIIDGPPASYLCTSRRCKFLTQSSIESEVIGEFNNIPFHICDEKWHWARNITFSVEALNNAKHIFVHIPKTGGTSILNLPTLISGGHIYARYYPKCYREKLFAIVRNPYSRLVSAYLFMKRGGFRNNREYRDLVQRYPTFESWVLLGLHEKDVVYVMDNVISELVTPQHFFLCGESELDIIIPRKNILRFENYAKDIERHLGIPNDEQRHYNIATISDNYKKIFYTNEAVKNKVYHLYKADFILFGYQREEIPTFSYKTIKSVVFQMSTNRNNRIDPSKSYVFGLEAFHNPEFSVNKENIEEWFSLVDELFIASYYSDNKSTCDKLTECLLTFILRNNDGAKIYVKRFDHINRNLNFTPQKGRFDWPLSSKERPCLAFSLLLDERKKRLFEFFREVPVTILYRELHIPQINCSWCKIT